MVADWFWVTVGLVAALCLLAGCLERDTMRRIVFFAMSIVGVLAMVAGVVAKFAPDAPKAQSQSRPQQVASTPHTSISKPPNVGDSSVVMPPAIELQAFQMTVKNDGYVITEGRFRNASKFSLSRVRILVEYYSETESFIGSDWMYSEIENIRPGQTSPFKLIDKPDRKPSKCIVRFLDADRNEIRYVDSTNG